MNAFSRRGACPALSAPMQTGDGLLVRLNPTTGGFSPDALIGLCDAALRHGNGIMEVTARGSLQIRGLTEASARHLALEVGALNIPVRAGVPVEIGPLAGLDPDEIADPRPLAQAIREAIARAGLSPRLGPKVSVIVDGGGRLPMDEIIADVRLVAVRQDDEALWQCAVGGTSATARQLNVFSDADALRTALAILEVIAEIGLEGRAKDLGSDALVPLHQSRPLSLRPHDDGQGKHPALGLFSLADSTHALGVALPFGSMPAEKIAGLTQEAAALGAAEIRSAPGRMVLVLGLSVDSCRRLQDTAAALGFVTDAADPRTRIAACPGAPSCASGMIETRKIAEEIAAAHAGMFDSSFTLHVSGCAKGCAHPAAATLTVVGDEKGAGLVVDGTAKALPVGYTPRYDAAQGVARIAAAMQGARSPDENGAACLARLGAAAIAKAYRQD